jgi:endonuclease V-like protein UPF0215 family
LLTLYLSQIKTDRISPMLIFSNKITKCQVIITFRLQGLVAADFNVLTLREDYADSLPYICVCSRV